MRDGKDGRVMGRREEDGRARKGGVEGRTEGR